MKNNALKFINPVLALLLLLTVIGVTIYKFGPENLRGSEAMAQLHSVCGILFFLTGLIHLYFNWTWVRSNIFGIKKHKSSGK